MHDVLNTPLGTVLGLLAGMLPVWLVRWWLQRRDERRWAVREMEQYIREEAMSQEWRDWHHRFRARRAEIAREVRRRLGLPQEEP
jgi:hypothetical protein